MGSAGILGSMSVTSKMMGQNLTATTGCKNGTVHQLLLSRYCLPWTCSAWCLQASVLRMLCTGPQHVAGSPGSLAAEAEGRSKSLVQRHTPHCSAGNWSLACTPQLARPALSLHRTSSSLVASGCGWKQLTSRMEGWRTVWRPSQPAKKCGHALVMEQMLSNTLLVGPLLSLSLSCNESQIS